MVESRPVESRPNESQPNESRPAKQSITDSPWYWVYLFATAGLIALMLADAKFSSRQTQIERAAQGRQRAVQNVSGKEPVTPMSEAEHTQITLRPLYLTLAAFLGVAWVNLGWRHFRRKREVVS